MCWVITFAVTLPWQLAFCIIAKSSCRILTVLISLTDKYEILAANSAKLPYFMDNLVDMDSIGLV